MHTGLYVIDNRKRAQRVSYVSFGRHLQGVYVSGATEPGCLCRDITVDEANHLPLHHKLRGPLHHDLKHLEVRV